MPAAAIQKQASRADKSRVTAKRGELRPPSKWWLVVSGATWFLAALSLVLAITHQRQSSQPIGEGDVFVEDASVASAEIVAAGSPEEGVRHARNALGIEAVSLVDTDANVLASTSQGLVGTIVANPLLASGASDAELRALAVATSHPIEIDGVLEWPVGSILYQVVSPIDGTGGSVLLHYDVSALIGRRTQPGEIQPLTIQLLALGGIFTILGAAVLIGHSRASRRHREIVVESELLRVYSAELETTNRELAAARGSAERALALAEEKMRIRSDFVLMINHELRTPLTAVVTGAELVRNGDLDDQERDELLDSMVAHGRRLKEIVDQILAVARIENKGLAYELNSIPLAEVCLATDATPEGEVGPVDVLTDERTLALVLASLADNARTHGASQVEVTCSTHPMARPMIELGELPPRAVYFLVRDDGPGIDRDFLPRAFEKFEKNSFSSGTGLGLYMVRLMVEALRGSIAVRTDSSGTTFQIAVPAMAPHRVMEPV